MRLGRSILTSSPQMLARMIGFGYLVIIGAGIFAEFVVRGDIIVPGNANATANNILASEQIFRFGLASEAIMLISDAAIAVGLYVLLAPVSKGLSLLAASFRLLHSGITAANMVSLILPLLLLTGGTYVAATSPAASEELAVLFLNAHKYGYNLGLVFFGVHLLVLGPLLYWSRYVPRVLAILIVFSALAYLADGFWSLVSRSYETTPSFLIGSMVIGEFALCIWLLVFGVTVRRASTDGTSGLATATSAASKR